MYGPIGSHVDRQLTFPWITGSLLYGAPTLTCFTCINLASFQLFHFLLSPIPRQAGLSLLLAFVSGVCLSNRTNHWHGEAIPREA